MSKPKLTIITVTLNAAELLLHTIASVGSQSFKDYEYIVIDGCSVDDTQSVVQANSKFISDYISEKDNGIYEAMNKGIQLSSGEWVIFMNSGDEFASEDTLEKAFSYIHDSSDVAYGDRYYVRKNSDVVLQKARPIETIYERMPFGHQAAFVKTELLKKYYYNETYKFAADYDLFMRLFHEKAQFQYIPLAICKYLSGGASESGLRPYLEVLKILLDNTKDKSLIKNNIYMQAFQKEASKLIDKAIN